jgi:catechol 2,3-dioxygenase-like lactoylglutathione lyase family enzyme
MSNSAFEFDHIHIISQTPAESANWYVEMLGAHIKADTVARGAAQIFLDVGGKIIVIRGARPGEIPAPTGPIREYADFASHNEWGTDLSAKGVSFPVALKEGVGGRVLCYVSAPDGVSIELMQAE